MSAPPSAADTVNSSGAHVALIHGRILPDPEVGEVFEHSVTLVREDTLIAVNDEHVDIPPQAEVIDCEGKLIMPGLINAHCHAAMSLLRGIADDLSLDVWLHDHIFPAEARFSNPRFVSVGAKLAFAECALGGVTSVADGYYHQEVTAQAAQEVGLRAVIAQGILDVPTPDCALPGDWPRRTQEFLERFPHHPLTTPALFCHSAYLCGPETLVKATRIAQDKGLLMFCHVAESQWEVHEIVKRYGRRPIAHLAALGILQQGFVAVHCVHPSDQEIDELACTGACVVHCPESNMKLASGAAEIPRLLSRGIVVGLGTDGPASNNNLDMIEEMRTASLLAKLVSGDPRALDAHTALCMATVNGARILGLSDLVGTLVPGKRADIAVVRMRSPHLAPVYDLVSHLVYAARGSDVSDVLVNGRVVVRNGRLRTVNVNDLLAEAGELAEHLGRRKGSRLR
jgi:5-methylthioadenosine/S-adenosylhomocysteine deaminase